MPSPIPYLNQCCARRRAKVTPQTINRNPAKMLRNAQGKPITSTTPDVRSSESMAQDPSSTYPPNNAYALPESYDDQVAFLYNQIEELKRLFEQFIEDHQEMKTYRDLRDPMGRLVISPNVVKVTLEEFCKAVKCVRSSFLSHFKSRYTSSLETSSPRSLKHSSGIFRLE
jgi:hypothetical protein